MPYVTTTYGAFKQALATRLGDPSNTYWSYAELGVHAAEAIRTWQSFTRYWRNTFTFDTAAPASPLNPFYDLTQQANTLVPYTQTDVSLLSSMCYALIEAQMSGATWNGTDMFTTADLVGALQRRRDQFLVETGMVLTRQLVAGPAPPISRLPLPQAVIDVRRGAWIDAISGNVSLVWKNDEWRAQALRYDWATSTGIPTGMSVAVTPPVSAQLMPPPAAPGTLELLSVNSGAPLNPATGVLLGIPDDFAWVVRWGALADLLGQDGQSRDPARAAYCEQRWQEGILAAKAYTNIETSYVNGVQYPVSSLFDFDTMFPGWENAAASVPTSVLVAGWNLVAVVPIPSTTPESVQVDIVQNAPIPASDAAFLQLGQEELDALLDYAQHLATFKQGGAEFKATMRAYANFKRLALVRNLRLAAALRSGAQPLFDKGWREERQRTRVDSEVPVGISLDEGGE